MPDSPAPLSDLSEPLSSDEAPRTSPVGDSAQKARSTSSSDTRTEFDRAAKGVLSNRGWGSAKSRSASPSSAEKEEKAGEKTRRATRSSTRLQNSQVQKEEVVKAVAPYVAKSVADSSNALQEPSGPPQALQAIPSAKDKLATLLTSVGATKGAEDILSVDPSDRLGGYKDLEVWVDGSLDLYRPEFRPLLFPIFCHFYLDLIQQGLKDMALKFFKTFSPPLVVSHTQILHHLSTLLLPLHAQSDALAQRFRSDKYSIKMSKSGFGLLIGWLTEGLGGEAPGAGESFSGEAGKRGRVAVMQVVNNHLRFDITSSSSTVIKQESWEAAAGLTTSHIPNGLTSLYSNVSDFNSAQGPLKLGAAPLEEGLQQEVERTLREEAGSDPHAAVTVAAELQFLRPTLAAGLIEPAPSELLPQPPTFRTVDIRREVERVRDARKKIRLDPSHLTPHARNVNGVGPQGAMARARSLPSICAYTLHDTGDSMPCSTFSLDASLMACGFSESYIRLWNLKGEKLRGMRSDFQESTIRDSSALKRAQERGGSTTRKLIGHSGPVYSVAFDPSTGSAAPPKHLLSCSADATVRLWSMDTMTNVVAYRGHENPVWDVQWSPMSVYFATASRDRTARLWSADRTVPLRIFAGHLSDVDCVRFHANSLYLATGSSDWTCRLWDVHRGNCVRVFLGHQGAITAMTMSNDGKYLASAGDDLAICLWDMGSGTCIKKLTGHTAAVHSLSFSAESSLLVSGGADWTVRCWDVKGAGGRSYTAGLANGRANGFPASQDGSNGETSDLLATFPTKRTSIVNIQFTSRNLCMAAGASFAYDHR